MLVHTVYFWIKEGAPAGEREKLLASCRERTSMWLCGLSAGRDRASKTKQC